MLQSLLTSSHQVGDALNGALLDHLGHPGDTGDWQGASMVSEAGGLQTVLEI